MKMAIHRSTIRDAEAVYRSLPAVNCKSRDERTDAVNSSGIRPMEYKVLVKPEAVEEKTKGGIILPDSKREKDEYGRTEGILVAVSPVAFTGKGYPEGSAPVVGDRVIFSRYSASEVKGRDGEDYWLMNDEAIAGVMADV